VTQVSDDLCGIHAAVGNPLTARQPSARTLPGDGVTEMPDNIPPWSGSDAMDRLRVAIEKPSKGH
jgi:hypothetical protein